jgi:hypothetical protein
MPWRWIWALGNSEDQTMKKPGNVAGLSSYNSYTIRGIQEAIEDCLDAARRQPF